MREVLYKKETSAKDRRKIMSIVENSEDQKCRTRVKKGFIYTVTPVEQAGRLGEPEIYITKYRDSRTRVEKFSFKVKGAFYITHEQRFFRVDFLHNLHINLNWKTKMPSPKPVTPP